MPMQPRPMAETFGPVVPSLRLSTVLSSIWAQRVIRAFQNDPDMKVSHCGDKPDNHE